MTTTISIFEHKGGVGKTTTAASLGGILASRFGKRVLLVDIDAQKNLSQTFGVTGDESGTVYDLFSMLETHKLPSRLPIVNIRDGLDILPSDDRVCTLDKAYGTYPGWESVLRKVLGMIRDNYDYIIVDSPAQIGVATTNALAIADCVVIPVNSDGYSMGGLKQTLDLVDRVQFGTNSELRIAGILKTRYQKRRKVDSAVAEQLEAGFNDIVFKTSIRECAAVGQSSMMRLDIFSYDEQCAAAQDYVAFAEELLDRLEGWGLKR